MPVFPSPTPDSNNRILALLRAMFQVPENPAERSFLGGPTLVSMGRGGAASLFPKQQQVDPAPTPSGTPSALPTPPSPAAQNAGQGPGEPPSRGRLPSVNPAPAAPPAAPAAPSVSPPPVPAPGTNRVPDARPASPAAPAAGGPSGGPGGALAGDPAGANRARFPLENPQFALQSALIAAGVNPFAANPMMRYLMGYAPGLAQSFLVQNAGASAEDIKNQGAEGAMFGNFLQRALSGGLANAMASGADLQSALGQAATQSQQLLQAGLRLDDVNPLAAMLATMYDDPQGAAGAYGALYAPFLSDPVGRAFQGTVNNAVSQQYRRLINEYEQGTGAAGTPFWQYLFS